MRPILLSLFLALAGALPCKSQDVILLREGGESLTGRVLWAESKGDSLFYRSAVPSGDSLLLFIPRCKIEYVVRSDDSRMMYRGRKKGWQPWRGHTFNEVPRQRMLYGASWSTILDGWSVDASVLRMMNRNHRIGVGAFVRYLYTEPYLSTTPSCDGFYRVVTYDHRAVAFGPQIEIRGYSRRLNTFFYADFGLGATCHLFDWGMLARDYFYDWIEKKGHRSDYMSYLRDQYPSSCWSYQFNYRLGAYVRLTRGLYADVAFTGIGHILTRLPSRYFLSDQFPFGLSVGLRFGREQH